MNMTVDTIIDIEWLRSATYADMKTVLNASARHPEKVADLNALFATPEGMKIANEMINDPDYIPVSQRLLDPADEAQRLEDVRLAEEQAAADVEAQRLADEQAAVAPVIETPVVPVPEPIAEKKKIVVDYQATTEDGIAIGRPTHIEGWSNEEVIEKMKAAHINAVRYAERVKRGRVKDIETTTQAQQLEQQATKSEQEAADAVAAAVGEKDPAKLKEAIQKTTRAERDREIARQTALKQGQIIADTWVSDHKEDFLLCDANSKIMGEWMATNGLVLTYENLEAAFTANKTKLVKPEYRQPVEEPAVAAPNAPAAASVASPAQAPVIPAPPAPVAAEPVITPVVPVSQPAAAAPSPTPAAAANPAPAARRPGVNGGIAPGTLSAARPSNEQAPQTTSNEAFLKEVHDMPAPEYRKKLATSKQFRDQLKAAGIKIEGESQYRTTR